MIYLVEIFYYISYKVEFIKDVFIFKI